MRACLGVIAAITMTLAAPAAAFETAPDGTASTYLGAAAQGPGYKVDPVVQSDGFLRIFTFETSHGKFEVNGVALAKQRVQELHALSRLGKMSESDVFTKSLGNAALAPVKFGAAL